MGNGCFAMYKHMNTPFALFRARSFFNTIRVNFQRSASPEVCRNRTHKSVLVMGMNNVGKTTLLQQLEGIKCFEIKVPEQLYFSEAIPYPFEFLRKMDIQAADAFILVYAVDDVDSFDYVTNLLSEIIDIKGYDVPLVVVGNKIDKERVVHPIIADCEVTIDFECKHKEVCAASGEGMKDVYTCLLGFYGECGNKNSIKVNLHRSTSQDRANKSVVVMGLKNVGKTTLLQQLEGISSREPALDDRRRKSEISVDVKVPGQLHFSELEAFRCLFKSLREMAIQDADAFVLVYAVDDDDSFDYVTKLLSEIIAIKGDDVPLVVVGNKVDKVPRVVHPIIADCKYKEVCEAFGEGMKDDYTCLLGFYGDGVPLTD